MSKRLIKGNDAVVVGAIMGGATHFFGYPITPASEIAHAAAIYFPMVGGTFLQAESEVNAINMLYGASAAGTRVMTASSGPGVSLMAEGISYMSGAELPCVIIDVQRAGPGLGNIWPEQGDYNLITKGCGHGDFRNIVLAPNSAQEMCDFTHRAFDLADEFRTPVFVLSDAYIGQMMEPVDIPSAVLQTKRKDWALYADQESRPNLISSIYMNKNLQNDHNRRLQAKYQRMADEITDYEEFFMDDAELLFVAFGISSRIAFSTVQHFRQDGVKAGLLRPKTLYPFPGKRVAELSEQVERILCVELNSGQMADDVERYAAGRAPVERHGWMGGQVPSPAELAERVMEEV